MTNPHHARLMASNAKLLQTGKYSDLKIKCGAREWQLHRSIVCERSKFFAAACDGPFLESSSREIDLKDDDATIFEYLLSYLYTLDYDDGFRPKEDRNSSSAGSMVAGSPAPEEVEAVSRYSVVETKAPDVCARHSESVPNLEVPVNQEKSSLMVNVQVYAMADKFDIAELKSLAREKFSKCAQGWPLPDFLSVVHEALTSTPESDRGLRDILRKILADHVEDILPADHSSAEDPALTATQDVRQQWCHALRDEGRFLYEVLGTVAANKASELERLRMTNQDVVTDLQSSQQEALTLKSTIKQLKREKVVSESTLATVKSRGARLIQEIDTRDHCRHCKLEFQTSFKDITSYNDWHHAGSLRCKQCHTKHSF